MSIEDSVNVHLVFPPFAESAVTGPHLACPLLVAVLRKAGIVASYSDWNIKAVRRALEPVTVGHVHARLSTRLGKHHANVRALSMLLAYERECYEPYSLNLLRRLLGIVGAELRGTEQRFEFSLTEEAVEDELQATFRAGFEQDFLAHLDVVAPNVLGISVAFSEQLPEALRLARVLRRQRPQISILVGGSQINLLADDQVRALNETGLFDGIVVGNGEMVIVDAVRSLRTLGAQAGVIRSGPITSDDLGALPPPAFANTDAYFRPLRIPVLAQKGCYWGRCTFCDYVRLADLGGRRYVSRSHMSVLAEILELDEACAPDSFLLVSDAVPPAWYRKLANAAIERRAKLKTSSYMMHGRALSRPDFDLFAEAGVETIVFGSESTDNRLLTLMKKPAPRDVLIRNICDARRAGIFTVVNAIIDFPTTTYEEASAVLSDFRRLMPFIDVFNPSLFDLTAGTEIASNAAHYGVRINESTYVRSNHGFHSLAASSDQGMTDEERDTILAGYQHLAVACSVRLRMRSVGRPQPTDLLRFDHTAVLDSSPPHRLTLLSLGAVRTLPPWEHDLLKGILREPSRWWSLEELRRKYHEWALDSADAAFQAWIGLLFRSGLVVAREGLRGETESSHR